MPGARLVGHVWWQCSSGLIRIANAIVCVEERGLVGLRVALPPEIEFGPYVLRSGSGTDAGCCGRGLGRGGRVGWGLAATGYASVIAELTGAP